MSRRFQFSLRALLVVMLVAAAFFAGMVVQRRLVTPLSILRPSVLGNNESNGNIEILEMPDGTRWFRATYSGTPSGFMRFPGDHGESITISTRPQPR
jgi:hypothetical protein